MADVGELNHPVFARFWAAVSPSMDRGGLSALRARLLAGLRGAVVEVGAGNGLNFRHYPPEVTQVVAVEPEPHLRRLAERQAERAPVPVRVVEGLADRLPAPDGAFDAAVASLMLCSVWDQEHALDEMRRVLVAGGQLRFLEHVLAEGRGHRLLQRAIDATVGPHVAGGCHTARDTGPAIARAGFRIDWMERLRYPATRLPLPTAPHILGSAVRL